MKAERDSVVLLHYDLLDEHGQSRETSREGAGLAVLVGHQNIIDGVDSALIGRQAGEQFKLTVPPESGYGLRQDDAVRRVSRKHVASKGKPKVGDRVSVRTERGHRAVTVHKVGRTVIDVDTNHPYAGDTLYFDIEILQVRKAESEELTHGHVHGDRKSVV